MARKVKTPKVPLSGLDKFVYVMLWLVGFSAMLAVLLVCGLTIPEAVAFSDPTVVAHNGIASFFCAIPMAGYISLTLMILVAYGWEHKQPIFGNKKFKPKFGQPVIKTFPLFSKEFRDSLNEKQKKRIKRIALILLILFVACAVILPFGIYPRSVLDNQNHFKHYNSFNQLTDEVTVEEANRLILEIDYSSGHRGSSPSWGIRLTFEYEHRDYVLSLGVFGDMEREDVLRHMMLLKRYFSEDQYEIQHIDRMERLVDYQNFTDAELKLVYDLFDYVP